MDKDEQKSKPDVELLGIPFARYMRPGESSMLFGGLDSKEDDGKKKTPGMKRGGRVKKFAKGGSASSRADGCAIRGKTKGRFI